MRRVQLAIVPAIVVALATAAAPPSIVRAADVPAYINGNASATKSLAVTVTIGAVPGATTMLVSSGGGLTKELPYATSFSWDLGDPQYGGSSAQGLMDVLVDVYAGADFLTGGFDSIVYDSLAPTESNVAVRFTVGYQVVAGKVPYALTWLDDDHGGIGAMDFAARAAVDGVCCTTLASGLQLPGTRTRFAPGHTYQIAVHATDIAGNSTAWIAGPTFRDRLYQESNASLKWTGTWSRLASSSFWGGAERTSTRAGSTVKLTFTGRRVALVARQGPKLGAFAVYVNGSRVGTVDLGAPTTHAQQVVWSQAWATSASRTLTLKVLSVPNRTRGDVDAIVVGG
jgi:hypothetical protein